MAQGWVSRGAVVSGFIAGLGLVSILAVVVLFDGAIGNDEGTTEGGNVHAMAAVHDHRGLGAHAAIVRPAAIHTVRTDDAGEVRTLPGRVTPPRASRLAFRVGGPLVDLRVREGDIVEAGTLLAAIDPRDYVITVDQLTADRGAAEAALRLAELNYERSVQLRDRGASAQAVVDRTSAERDQALAELAALRQRLAAAEAALADTRLVAPFRGRVAQLHVEAFDFVVAGNVAITLHDVAGTELVVFVPERLLARLDRVTDVAIKLASRPDEWQPAQIHEIASDASADVGAFRTTLRQAHQSGAAPLAGTSGSARLVFGAASDVITVPTSALFARTDGGDFVWLVAPGAPARVRAQAVELGAIIQDRTRIRAGLDPGDRIVAYGVDFLIEGQAVRPLKEAMAVTEALP